LTTLKEEQTKNEKEKNNNTTQEKDVSLTTDEAPAPDEAAPVKKKPTLGGSRKRYVKFRKNKIKFINNIYKSLALDLQKSWDTYRSLNGFRDMIENTNSLVNKIKEEMDITDDEVEYIPPLVIPINYVEGGNPFRSTLDSKFVVFKMDDPPLNDEQVAVEESGGEKKECGGVEETSEDDTSTSEDDTLEWVGDEKHTIEEVLEFLQDTNRFEEHFGYKEGDKMTWHFKTYQGHDDDSDELMFYLMDVNAKQTAGFENAMGLGVFTFKATRDEIQAWVENYGDNFGDDFCDLYQQTRREKRHNPFEGRKYIWKKM